MSVEIRPVPAADTRRWFDAVNASFAEFPEDEQWELDQKILEPERVLGAYDGERIVGGGGAFSFRMTVPGGRQVATGGVTMVGVLPTHRRQGALRKLMARQLADVRSAGEPLAALWASEGSIYQRFGYGLASLNGRLEIERDRATFRNPIPASGTFELLEAAEARGHMQVVYDAVRAVTPGFYVRSETWWDVVLADPLFRRRDASRKFHAIHRRDGRAVGYVVYRVKSDWIDTGPASTLLVVELMAVDAEATQQVWRYAFGVDLMKRIHSRLGPADHPLLLLVAEPRRLQLRVGDALWLRIVDVPAALEGRGYAADGTVVLEVADEFMPEVAGTWRLTTTGGSGRVQATTEPADIRLDITDLGAVYLGAFSFTSLARAGRTTEFTAGARASADRMLASDDPPPWCPEVF
jgi:predicted acetyltransferase